MIQRIKFLKTNILAYAYGMYSHLNYRNNKINSEYISNARLNYKIKISH